MINTKGFKVTELKQQDALSLHHLMASNKERFSPFFPKTLKQNLSVKASKAYIERKGKEQLEKIEFTWGIKDNVTNSVIGLIILKELDWNKGIGEFAYCIDKNFEGKGWITHIVKEASEYAFNNLGLKTLQIIVHKSNKASTRVAEKCGFTWQKTLIQSYTPPGKNPLDMELFELYHER